MKILTSLITSKRKVLPPFIVIVVLLLAGSFAFAFSPQSPLISKQSETSAKTISYKAQATQAPILTPQVTSSPHNTVLGAQTQKLVPTVAAGKTADRVKEESSSTNNTQSITSSNTSQTTVPTQTPVTQQATPTTAQAASQTVSVEIKTPDSSPSFTVEFHDGMNVCDVLQKAKGAGKITSVTLDDSYMSTLHSKYVAEINGFSNNWTFSVNGTSPLGCSLYQPKPNDTIVWKFG